jgi:hypothetical protein
MTHSKTDATSRAVRDTEPKPIVISGLTPEQKNLFDALSSLREAAWTRYDRRRDFEWKLSFGIWTMLATLTGFLLTDKLSTQVQQQQHAVFIGVAVFVVVVFSIHFSLQLGIRRKHKRDLEVAGHYAKRLAAELQFSVHANELNLPEGRLMNSHVAQLAITAVLCAALVFTVFLRIKT